MGVAAAPRRPGQACFLTGFLCSIRCLPRSVSRQFCATFSPPAGQGGTKLSYCNGEIGAGSSNITPYMVWRYERPRWVAHTLQQMNVFSVGVGKEVGAPRERNKASAFRLASATGIATVVSGCPPGSSVCPYSCNRGTRKFHLPIISWNCVLQATARYWIRGVRVLKICRQEAALRSQCRVPGTIPIVEKSGKDVRGLVGLGKSLPPIHDYLRPGAIGQ